MKRALCVDIGGTHTRIAVGTEDGTLETITKVPTATLATEKDMAKAVESVRSQDCISLGVSTPGLIYPKAKRITKAHNIPCYDFGLLEAELDLPVVVENDANSAALGERQYGAAKGVDNLVFLIWGTGMGCGVIYDGRLLGSRPRGRAGEVGSLVVDATVPAEPGGRNGRWSSFCSGRGMPKYVNLLLQEETRETALRRVADLKAEDLFVLAKEGDEVAKDYVGRIAKYNAAGVGSLINVYSPDVIVLGGSIATGQPELVETVKQQVPLYAVNPVPEFRMSQLGDNAGLFGALHMGLEAEVAT